MTFWAETFFYFCSESSLPFIIRRGTGCHRNRQEDRSSRPTNRPIQSFGYQCRRKQKSVGKLQIKFGNLHENLNLRVNMGLNFTDKLCLYVQPTNLMCFTLARSYYSFALVPRNFTNCWTVSRVLRFPTSEVRYFYVVVSNMQKVLGIY